MYLVENRYDEPKEIFKRIAERLREAEVPAGARVADLGCAAGELLYLLRRELPTAELLGFDVVPELLEKAARVVEGVTFAPGSVTERSTLEAASIDVALMLGVHSIFEEVTDWLPNLLHWTRPGGRILVFGLFNPAPVDVWVRYRDVKQHPPEHREPGWNIPSRHTVAELIEAEIGAGRHSFTPFELPFDLAPHADDPVRTWTERLEDGRRFFTNGLSLRCSVELLDIAR